MTQRMCVEALRWPARRMAVCTLTFRVGQGRVVRAPERVEVERAELAGTRLNQAELSTLGVVRCSVKAGRGADNTGTQRASRNAEA